MLARITTAAILGLDGHVVEVQTDLTPDGLPGFVIVGLPDDAVREARDRVRAAVRNSGFEFPTERVTVNLAPAEIPKTGPTYDLPLAVSVLIASGQLEPPTQDALYLGELSLDGQVRHATGILPMVATAREAGLPQAFVPSVDAREAALVDGLEIVPVGTLAELVGHLRREAPLPSVPPTVMPGDDAPTSLGIDLADVRGQEHAKRALEVAAAGSHNVLMSGPPGAGQDAAGAGAAGHPAAADARRNARSHPHLLGGGPAPARLPGRPAAALPGATPHHLYAGLVGGGAGLPRPGEVSLAHRGVLFLDEMPEFGHRVLEVMRQPIEDGVVTIARSKGTLTFPARVQLVAARNPCPCGYAGDSQRPCSCAPQIVSRYRKRLSGPILDRIDVHLDVPRIDHEKLADSQCAESSAAVRARVMAARRRQWRRLAGTGLGSNAELGLPELRLHCQLDEAGAALMRTAFERLGLSARAYHRVLKVARTIADLAESDAIETPHLLEAIQYQPRNED